MHYICVYAFSYYIRQLAEKVDLGACHIGQKFRSLLGKLVFVKWTLRTQILVLCSLTEVNNQE